MKRTIAILLCSLLLAGCSVSRVASSAAKSTEAAEVQTAEVATQTTVENEVKTIDTDVEVSTVVEVFDTSQPADPATGAPPLKSRTITTATSRAKEASAASKTTAEATTSESREQTNATAESEAAENEKKESVSVFRWLKIGAVAGLIFTLIVVAFWKRIKNQLKPF